MRTKIIALMLTLVLLLSTAHTAMAAPKTDPNDWLCWLLCIGNTTAPQSAPSSSGGDYQTMAYNDAVAAGIDPILFQKQINQESGFNPNAVSRAGAIGIAQIMASTAKTWAVDPWNPVDSLRVAAQHMAAYQSAYGSFAKALACYNAGCGSLDKAMRSCADYYNCLPSETRAYITKITG